MGACFGELGRENKVLWGGPVPTVNHGSGRHPIKGGVDLHGSEKPVVKGKLLLLPFIEGSNPLLIIPATRPKDEISQLPTHPRISSLSKSSLSVTRENKKSSDRTQERKSTGELGVSESDCPEALKQFLSAFPVRL